MTKQEILSALEASRAELLTILEGRTPEELLAPAAAGEWSVRDVLQHLSLWEAELIRLFVHLERGRKPAGEGFVPHPDYDAINARWHAETRERPLDRVLEDLHGVRRQTLQWISRTSDEALNKIRPEAWLRRRSLAGWIAAYTYEHEREHITSLRAWREAKRA